PKDGVDLAAAGAVITIAVLVCPDAFAVSPGPDLRPEGLAVPPGEEARQQRFHGFASHPVSGDVLLSSGSSRLSATSLQDANRASRVETASIAARSAINGHFHVIIST